jgi:hypothetical protein
MNPTLAQLAGFFTAPAIAVAGLACVAIPIIIHLLSRHRRKRAVWGAMRFLQLAYQKQKRRLQLERWLLLLTRCLLILVAGLALANPIAAALFGQRNTPGTTTSGGRTVHLIIDNDLSTQASVGGEAVRFDALRERALDLIDNLDTNDRVAIWTTTQSRDEPAASTSYDHDDARNRLEAMLPTAIASQLEAVLGRVTEAVRIEVESNAGARPTVVLLSDLARGDGAGDRPLPAEIQQLGEIADVVISRPEVGSSNVQISRLEPRRTLVLAGREPGLTGSSDRWDATSSSPVGVGVRVELRRLGEVATEAQASLHIELIDPAGQVTSTAERSVRWLPGQAEVTLGLELPLQTAATEATAPPTGPWAIRAMLQSSNASANALATDDQRWVGFEVRDQIRVGIWDDGEAPNQNTAESGGSWQPEAFLRAALAPAGRQVLVHTLQPGRLMDSAEGLASLDAVIVTRPDLAKADTWDHLHKFAQAGGLIWVFQPADADAGVLRDSFMLMRQAMGLDWSLSDTPVVTVDGAASSQTLLVDRRPPSELLLLAADWRSLLNPIRVSRWLDVEIPEQQHWLSLSNEQAWVASLPIGAGRLIWAGTSLSPDWTNLPTKPLFPALIQDALRGSIGSGGKIKSNISAGDRPTLGPAWQSVNTIARPQAEPVLLVTQASDQRTTDQRLSEPGLYTAQPQPSHRVVVNVDPAAGDLTAIPTSLLETWLEPIAGWQYDQTDPQNNALNSDRGNQNPWLGRLLLWVLLTLVLFELALARWFSHARSDKEHLSVRKFVSGSGRKVTRKLSKLKKAANLILYLSAALFWPSLANAGPLDWLLGLSNVSTADDSLALGWRYPLPTWVWVMIVIAAGSVAWWSYRHLMGRREIRYALATLRTLLIVLVAVLLAGPQLVRSDETIEPDTLLVMLDRSASMQIEDEMEPRVVTAASSEGAGSTTLSDNRRVSRDDAMHAALLAQAELFDESALARNRRIVWKGFAERAFPIDPPLAEPGDERIAADGIATALRSAIDQTVREQAGRPISGIVLITDGRSPEAIGPAFLAGLQQQSIRIFPVALGADQLPMDLAIARIDPPEIAFVKDAVPVSVVVEKLGGDSGLENDAEQLAKTLVELYDTVTGEVFDRRSMEGAAFGQPITLEARSERMGEATWAIRVLYNPQDREKIDEDSTAIASSSEELNLANNIQTFTVEMIDRPIRVLYIEGYPRWEYRYLKNMLLREQSIDSSMMLLSADRNFAQEGDTPIARLPESMEEWQRYDVVILGDVSAEVLSVEQQRDLYRLVAQRGRGLLWIGGSQNTPQSWAATALADLLPMRNVESVYGQAGRFSVRPTPLAEALSVLQLTINDVETNVDTLGWPDGLSPLRWIQSFDQLKPTAEVLAVSSEASLIESNGVTTGNDPAITMPGESTGQPLVTRLRFGSGQSLYVATDETWRWRFGRGEVYFERFWVQLVRMLGRASATRGEEQARLEVSSRQVPIGSTVVVDVTIRDGALLENPPDLLSVSVESQGAGDQSNAPISEQLELRPAPGSDEANGERRYTARWTPTRAGRPTLRVIDPSLAGLGLQVQVEVVSPDDELRRVEADPQRLAELAEATGGQVIALNNLKQLAEPGVLLNLSRRMVNDVTEPIWNSMLALALVVGLVTLEWVGRKLIQLV